MPLWLFASRDRSGAYAVRLLYLGAMIGFFYFTTQFFQDVRGWSPLQAGLGFLPMTVVNFAVATQVPRLVRRFNNQVLLAAGVIATLVGMAWLSRLTPDTGYLLGVALPMVLIGIGQGLTFAPLTTFGIAGVKAEDAGAASGLLNTAHQLGTALGLSILVAWLPGSPVTLPPPGPNRWPTRSPAPPYCWPWRPSSSSGSWRATSRGSAPGGSRLEGY